MVDGWGGKMKKSNLFRLLLWGSPFLLIISLNANAQQKKNDRPNVIIINMDDMGYGDTEPYGMTGIPTPNFNRAASEGMRLTHFNAAQAVCSPSRAALLTGCYPNRLSLAHALSPEAKIALNTSEETIASILKKAGYKTAMLGKWHLGSKAPFLPTYFGFDSFYGLPYSHDMWPVGYDGKPLDSSSYRGKYPRLPILDGEKVVAYNDNLEDQGKLTGTFTKKAVEFITDHQKDPFFLYLAQPMPHVPLAASKAFRGKSELGIFGDVIMELDWSIGEIMKTLDRYKLSENTILIITSDNGPWLNFGDNAGSSGGFREGKGTAWDGGTRVPCLIRWPGSIPAGSLSSQLMVNIDLLPTIAALTKAKLPAFKIDGMDFSDVLTGKSNKGPREVFYYYYDVNNLKAVRYKNWKLVFPHSSRAYSGSLPGKGGYPGPAPDVKVKMALYNLSHDPGEQYDVQENYPEIVKQIQIYAEEARVDLGDELTNRKGANRRPSGKVSP